MSMARDVDDEYGEGMSLKDIGTRVGLTRERVRQIEQEALSKLGELIDIPDEEIVYAS